MARPQLIIGRDTRRSGPLLSSALAAGLASEGVDVVDVGVVPTPAVAALAAERGVAAAIVSASHNPFADNGVKVLGIGGRKLPVETEKRIESEWSALLDRRGDWARHSVRGADVGTVEHETDAASWYAAWIANALGERGLQGIRVALDCANGALSGIAAGIFAAAGALVVAVIGDTPDGTNINLGCGSTEPGQLQAAVLATRADLGLAFDGDADRVIAVDELGGVIDGDQMLALFAADLHTQGRLVGNTVVATVMSNLGLSVSLERLGVTVMRTPVGDRNVSEALDEGGWVLGGEQSGHVIFTGMATTGDGLLTGLMLSELIRRRGLPASTLTADAMQRLPQVLMSVAVAERDALATATRVWDEVRRVEAALGDSGRVLLRASGTEPLVRVMVEGPTTEQATQAAQSISDAVLTALGAPSRPAPPT